MNSANNGTKRSFACPNCGETDSFVHHFTTKAWSLIDNIDADTGVIDWTGESDTDCDELADLGYECGYCTHRFTKDDFDPTKRLIAAMAGIDDLLKTLEEET